MELLYSITNLLSRLIELEGAHMTLSIVNIKMGMTGGGGVSCYC